MNKSNIAPIYFSKSDKLPPHLKEILRVFVMHAKQLDSSYNTLISDKVLSILRQDLENIGFQVEKKNNTIRKSAPWDENLPLSFEVDAFQESTRTILEVEAGATFYKNAFFRNLFRACIIPNVDYLVLAFRCTYKKRNKEFEEVYKHLSALYKSDRLKLPLKGILAIGY